MRTVAATYPGGIAQKVVAQLPRGHPTVLLDKVSDPGQRDWYAAAAAEHGWPGLLPQHSGCRRGSGRRRNRSGPVLVRPGVRRVGQWSVARRALDLVAQRGPRRTSSVAVVVATTELERPRGVDSLGWPSVEG